ncbi:exodeoxyribonuclease VII small subunit [Silanimonas sp.]|uniref:exodeoxyribonuclease VII small subunit n=1 Tax=Silanimonas sp. TaxID=1929290 RepID=UPI001BBCD522|nr:exodeoxyribonuclease VII small subunit [Silanimonas sp.]MBS3896902.1 exodeoxyribonuclease VII small subunit [Silanimonas sp.]
MPTPPNAPQAFEQALEELDGLVRTLESGDLSLEASLALYERGVVLYRQCQGALEQAELRIRLLADPADPASAREFQPDGG